MNLRNFQSALDERIARYELLQHPFYRAWSAGKLSREHLRSYAGEYYHLVAAFPTFLSALHSRLTDGPLRRAVLRNLAEEEVEGRAHSDMWLDFAEGVGLSPEQVRRRRPSIAMHRLIDRFYRCACNDSPWEVLASFYAYQSQTPRLSGEKACALLRHYGADERTCGYFAMHTYSGMQRSRLWRDELANGVGRQGELAMLALEAAERSARWLWEALENCDANRMSLGTVGVA